VSRIDGFFSPSSDLEVLRAINELEAETQGEVRSAELFVSGNKPARGGIFCAKLFGPIEDLKCLCGYFGGEEKNRGERCPKCGVEAISASVRNERWAHISAAWPLLHPRLTPAIARLLGWKKDDVEKFHRFEAGIEGGHPAVFCEEDVDWGEVASRSGPLVLQGLLADIQDPVLREAGFTPPDLLVWTIPVVPPGDRPLRKVIVKGRDRWFPAHGEASIAKDNQAYASLFSRNSRLGRLLELEAPAIILAHEFRQLQESFVLLVDMLSRLQDDPSRAKVASVWRGLELESVKSKGRTPPYSYRLQGQPTVSSPEDRRIHLDAPLDPSRPRALLFLDDDHIVLQLGYASVWIRIHDGRIRRVWPATEYSLIGTQKGLLIFGDKYGRQEDNGALLGAAVLDVAKGRWCKRYPLGLPSVYIEKDQPEDAWIYDWRNGKVADVEEDVSCDRADEVTRTPDHRFIWVGSSIEDGAVMSTETGLCHLFVSHMELPDQEAPLLGWKGIGRQKKDGWEVYDELMDSEDDEWRAVAIARPPRGRWRLLDAWQGVSRDGKVRFRLPLVPSAAAFNNGGNKLVVADRSRLMLVNVDKNRIECEFDLAPLAFALGTGKIPGVSPKLKDALLVRFGTVEGIRRQTKDTLQEVPGVKEANLKAIEKFESHRLPRRLYPTSRRE
jgi:hypothetical protein